MKNMSAPDPILSSLSPEGDFDKNNSRNIKPMKSNIITNSTTSVTKGNNMIKMKIKIGKEDVNKPTKILYNLKRVIKDCNLKELNESNTELYINNKKYKYKSYFTPEKEGIYDIQLNINILMKNCYCLFYDLTILQSVDLSSFIASDVTNMSYMFYGCKNLEIIDLSSFNTENVINMSRMFYGCENLANLDLSSFNNEKVTDMSNMFCRCYNLKSIYFSLSMTNNLTNMSYMFYECKSLLRLDLTTFNTINVTNMSWMFSGCENLQSLDLSSFNTKNVTKKDGMYNGCNKLERVILSVEAPNIYLNDKTFYA